MDYFKFGHVIIPGNLVFWNKQYCYCIIPVVKLLPGRKSIFNLDVLLIPKR
jgi:hypothetical protein